MDENLKGLDFSSVRISDRFWNGLISLVREKTIPACIDRCVETGRIENFVLAAASGGGEHSGKSYDDSDVYKVLEGIGYSLRQAENRELEEKADAIIDRIAAAQEGSGYLNTKHSLLDHGRFEDMDEHELYNGGHLLEAGIAYRLGTGKDKLLEVGRRFADHVMDIFGPGRREWVTGHQEMELALVKLGEFLGERKYLDFARWLLEQRGRGHGSRGPNGGKGAWDREYRQDLVPVEELDRIYGHAVRAMYMFAAMADLARLMPTAYLPALTRLWENICGRNMYVTGGIGQSGTNEGFTRDYHLPNESAYCETCAAVGMVFYNQRMFLLTGESKYLDVLEREIYNGVVSGLSLDGDRFFYDNPLESNGDKGRKPWFKTSCCPTQLARFIPSIGSYIYAEKGNELFVNNYISSELSSGCRLKLECALPNSGRVRFSGITNERFCRICLRIPSWANSHSVGNLDGATRSGIRNGFLLFDVGETFSIELNLEMKIDFIRARAEVEDDRGKLAVQYGPVVYCLEERDTADYDGFSFRQGDLFRLKEGRDCLHGRIVIEVVDGMSGGLRAELIPYQLWNNRGAGRMKVFIPADADQTLYSSH